MAKAVETEPFLTDLLQQNNEIDDEIRQVISPLRPHNLNWQPPDGGWTVAMVLEHLIVTDEQYFHVMGPVLESARSSDDSASQSWKPSFMGRLLYRGVRPDSERKLRAPTIFSPPVTPRVEVADILLSHQDLLADFIRRSSGLNLTRLRLGSPVSRMIRLNMGDCLAVLTAHTRRHMLQVGRLVNHPDFGTKPR